MTESIQLCLYWLGLLNGSFLIMYVEDAQFKCVTTLVKLTGSFPLLSYLIQANFETVNRFRWDPFLLPPPIPLKIIIHYGCVKFSCVRFAVATKFCAIPLNIGPRYEAWFMLPLLMPGILRWWLPVLGKFLYTWFTNFPIPRFYQSLIRRKGDMKQVPCWRQTNIGVIVQHSDIQKTWRPSLPSLQFGLRKLEFRNRKYK